jgi:arsenate reductase (thioredoxin)
MKPKVLFLCTGNSARSQMAEGYLRHVAADKYEVLSAGIELKGLHPLAVEVMREIGVDISRHKSKDVRQMLGIPIQYVVTVCDHAKEDCPGFSNTYKFLHWSLDDPAAVNSSEKEKLETFRRVRDRIIRKIKEQFLPAAVENNSPALKSSRFV